MTAAEATEPVEAPGKPASHHLGRPVRLGKASPRHDHRTLRLARYLSTSLPAPPPACDWSTKDSPAWGMMDNDTLGDCTCAAMGHAIQVWTASNGGEITLSDDDVLAAYEGACGYVPGDPSTDNGGVELDVLNYWRQTGVGGHKILAYAALEPKNRQHVEQAVFLFGGCYIGVALPLSAQNQTDWTVAEGGDQGDPTPGSWGGHAVFVVGYDADWVYFISWGQKLRMSWAFWNAYCDESYAVLSVDWCSSDGAPSKVDLAQLQADLAQVTDPASSADQATAAAARQARKGGVAPHDALTVTRRMDPDGGAEVVATTRAGLHLGFAIAPPADPADGAEKGMVTFRLLVNGHGQAVGLPIAALEDFVKGIGEACDHAERSRRPRESAPDLRDEGDDGAQEAAQQPPQAPPAPSAPAAPESDPASSAGPADPKAEESA